MSACPDRYESILLDVYGELDPYQGHALVRHFADCPGCREEHRKVSRLVEQIRAGAPAMVLSEDEARALTSSIMGKLLKGKRPSFPWKGLLSPGRLVPALAVACVVLVFVGWLSLRMVLQPPSQARYASNGTQEERLSPKDMEVISNLDLLEEMDVLKRLVRAVDGKETL